jgi:hypothetical protein
MNAAAGTCFGYEVRSSVALSYLRRGGGESVLDVRASEEDPSASPGELLLEMERPSRLFRDGDAFRLWAGGVGWYSVEPEAPSVHVPAAADALPREERLWGLPAVLCFRHRGDLPIHAAAVEVDGQAILLGAPGRFGKTTLAAGFCRAGHRVLAEDLSCVRLSTPPAVLPGPAMLRVRHDIAAELELPLMKLGESEDRVHYALDGQAGDGRPVGLRGIVLLTDFGPQTTLERVPAERAVRDLWALTFRLPTAADRARSFAEVAELAETIPVWELSRPRRLADLEAVVTRIAADV